MTIIILLTVILGAIVGFLLIPSSWIPATDIIMNIGLCLLLLFVGIDIGKQKKVLNEIKNLGVSIILIPIMIAIGSIVGALFAGSFIGLSYNESSAIGAGFGWYSLSAVLLDDYSTKLSALSFLTNVFREVFAIIVIPLVGKYVGYLEAVAPPGATAMDTTLPIITKSTDSKTAVLAFISGIILSTLVPVLVPLLISL